ncbi:DUF1707 and DUF2154 domain-containing protein [Kitasatospora sp. NA04385]|uniref:DUF1707 SHOCT-like domain-containing protein n=1 Tax=Kitasatospora sp. NA04385 TaxID=2742135 RepID=UPI0015913B5B|nr:DUF1707 domain-containing protein [Kitasatospora sp. NA04385]QKW21363.1 DUF1707 and DUF2154 domain-containing protein [Kitasatospora sp. NA04385]
MDDSPEQDPQGALPAQLSKNEPAPVPARAPGTDLAAELKASDADRERVADLLRDAYAEGRLTVDEHAERIEAAYGARTFGELEPLTRDLPSHPGAIRHNLTKPPLAAAPAAQAPLPPARAEAPTMLAVFGGAARKGRWRVGSHLKAVAVFGGIEIDLTDAVFESPEVVIEVYTVFGGVEIRVPENVSLHGGGAGVFGGFEVREQTAAEPYAPVVRVKGAAVFGGVEAKPRRGKKLKEWVRRQLDG